MTLQAIFISLTGVAFFGVTFGVVAAELLTWKWKKALLNKGMALERQRISTDAVERRLAKTENDLSAARNEARHWERVARKFEEEVMKILAGEN